ncbi:hypothetical protein ACVW00_002406 [Marmoricola sp. URHA0025 HA25]
MSAPVAVRRSSRFRVAKALALLRWQPDQWRRMTLTAAQVPQDAVRVLDVGGRGRQMASLLRPAEVTSVNVEPPADVVLASGESLPFPDGAFDVVLSTDVLEHVPSGGRAAHVAELIRVSRRRVVLCWPLGSTEKDAAERRLQAQLRAELGLSLDFLEEHLRYGLPREEQVRAMVRAAAPDARQSWLFQEGIVAGDAAFLDAMRAKHRRDVRALLRFVLRAYLRRPGFGSTSSRDTSRAYLVIDL